MKTILGARIRERRRELRLSQVELARRLGISASYMNLIEHNRRAIAGTLLRRAAEELSMSLDELDGAAERQLVTTLEEIAHLPEIVPLGAESSRSGELIGRYPGWARTVAALARSEREASENARALADRLTHDAFLGDSVHKMLGGIAAVRAAGEILAEYPDIEEDKRQTFIQIIDDECRDLTRVGEALATYFDKADEMHGTLTPMDEVEAMFEVRENRFEEIEAAASRLAGRVADASLPDRKQTARELAAARLRKVIDGVLAEHGQLETELATSRARDALLEYAVRALLMPSDRLSQEAPARRFDAEALAALFAVDFETVCHRLSALPRTGDMPRFGYFLANASGAIITRRNLPGLSGPRYASACPLWALFRAQQHPGQLLRQRALFPTGTRFVFLARARVQGNVGFNRPQHQVTDMLALSEEEAPLTVYDPDSTVPLESVGFACRSCPRNDCEHRVADPLVG